MVPRTELRHFRRVSTESYLCKCGHRLRQHYPLDLGGECKKCACNGYRYLKRKLL